METILYLIPLSLLLGGIGLLGFLWTLRTNQYDDPEGDARRILSDQYDDRPKAARDAEKPGKPADPPTG